MKLLLCAGLALLGMGAQAQTDHDNLDSGRPLRVEDAEPLSYRGLALEYGFGLNVRSHRGPFFDASLAFLSGLVLNGQFEVAAHGVAGDGSARIVDVDLGFLYALHQESRTSPALALKFGATLPTRSGGNAELSLRGIATRTVGRYDRLHLNLDVATVPASGRVAVGGVIGLSRPIGYPRRFDLTALAELAVVPAVHPGKGPGLALGIGVRKMISPRAVLDLGLQSDIAPGRGADPVPLRLIAGYSLSF